MSEHPACLCPGCAPPVRGLRPPPHEDTALSLTSSPVPGAAAGGGDGHRQHGMGAGVEAQRPERGWEAGGAARNLRPLGLRGGQASLAHCSCSPGTTSGVRCPW